MQEPIQFYSFGVDVGTATTHFRISQITLGWIGTRYRPTDCRLIAESPVRQTPYFSPDEIDAAAVVAFIKREVERSGLISEDISTGVVICTGIALETQNSSGLTQEIARLVGNFTTIGAGDRLEAAMSAYGSGAVALSRGMQSDLLHMDVGGGTTKLNICRNGEIIASSVVGVGARMLVFGDDLRISAIERSAKEFLAANGVSLAIGTLVDAKHVADLSNTLASELLNCALHHGSAGTLQRLPPISVDANIDTIAISGGVAEFVYGRESREFGDLGRSLGGALRRQVDSLGYTLHDLGIGIRATVAGASEQTIQVSGSTIHLSTDATLPMRDTKVIFPNYKLDGEISAVDAARATAEAFASDEVKPGEPVAIVIPWVGSAEFRRVADFCAGLWSAVNMFLHQDVQVVLACDQDVGGLLGRHSLLELAVTRPYISIDGLELVRFDRIDIGQPLAEDGALPVVVKSLMFPQIAPRH